jgi:sporulation integral membrane protein YtvI
MQQWNGMGDCMNRFFTKQKIWTGIGITLAIAALWLVIPVSLPIILAFLTALLLDPFVASLKKHGKIHHSLAVFIIFVIFIFFVGLFGYFIVTKVIAEVLTLIENSPEYFNELTRVWYLAEAKLVNYTKDMPDVVVEQFISQVQHFLQKMKEEILSYVNINNAKAILTKIPNYLISFIIYLVALYLFLSDMPKIAKKMYSHLTDRTANKVKIMTSRLSFVISSFIKAKFFISIVVYIISFVWLYMIAPKMAVYGSLLIWISDFVPFFSSFIVLVPWAIFHLLSGQAVYGIQLSLLAFVLLFVKKGIKPKLLGNQFQVSPLATLVVMYLGFKLFGIIGVLIGPLLLLIFNSAKEAGIIQLKFKL